MRKNKGFTLIELLGVIVILAVILVIAVPKILDVIETADKNAYKESVELMAHTAKLQYQTGEVTGGISKIPEGGIIYEFENGEYKTSNTLKFKGDKPFSGIIILTENKKIIIEKLVSKNKKWCASKEENNNLKINKCDEMPIESFNVSTTNTTKSIFVTVSPDDLETYYYKINDSEFETSKLNTKEYTELEKNKTYTITARGCRKNNSVCEEKSVTVSLPDLDIPTYSISSIPEDQETTNGWATSRTVTIDYNQDKVEGTDYTTLINQYVYASTQEELIEKIDNNNWNICETDSCALPEFTSETHIIARTTDGYNELSNSIITITNFDRENPSAPVITGGSEDWVNTNRTINVSTKSIAPSEIKKYQYYISTSSTELTGGSWTDCTTSESSQKFESAGTYYVFFRSQSYVGKYSEVSNVQVVKIDKTGPTCGSWSGTSNTWATSRTITLECSDSGSGCAKTSYTKSYSTTTKTATPSIEIADSLGNKTTCTPTSALNIYVDKTAPTLSNISNSSGSEWTKNNVTISYTSSDSHSGVNRVVYSYDKSTEYTDVSKTSGTWSDERNNSVYLKVYDGVGNASGWYSAGSVKIDKTAPTVTCTTSSDKGTIYASCSDSGSGCVNYESHPKYSTYYPRASAFYSPSLTPFYENEKMKPDSNGKIFWTFDWTEQYQVYMSFYDAVGNTNNCYSIIYN